jgi:hypothetical protein
MEHSRSLEANSCLASHEIPCILWNMTVHYHAHNSVSLAAILSLMNPVHGLHFC